MAKAARGKRDGSGPFKSSPRKTGRRQQAGVKCPKK